MDLNFKNQFCNGFHYLLMMSPSFNNSAIITVKGFDYCCNIYGVKKSDTIHLL